MNLYMIMLKAMDQVESDRLKVTWPHNGRLKAIQHIYKFLCHNYTITILM